MLPADGFVGIAKRMSKLEGSNSKFMNLVLPKNQRDEISRGFDAIKDQLKNAARESLREALTSGDFNMATQSLQKRLRIKPCTLKGYCHSNKSWKHSPSSIKEENQYLSTLQSRGNFSECRSAALMLLQKGKEKYSYQRCDIGSTFIPRLQGNFLATEIFFHTSKFFELGPRAFLSELMTAGQDFCEADWSKIKEIYQSLEEEDLLRYCFSSAYSVALLHDSLGVALDD